MSPSYVESIATMPWPPPYECTDVQVASMGLWTRYRLQSIVDEWLNAGGGPNDVRWRVLTSSALGDLVVFQALNYGKIEPTTRPWRDIGFADQTETYFCIPVIGWQGGIPVDVALFFPFIWVSNPSSVTGGREVLGIPKLMGFVECGSPPPSPSNTSDTSGATGGQGSGATTTGPPPPPWGTLPIKLDGPVFTAPGTKGTKGCLLEVRPASGPSNVFGAAPAASTYGGADVGYGEAANSSGSGNAGDSPKPSGLLPTGAVAPPFGPWLSIKDKLDLDPKELELLDHVHGVSFLESAPFPQLQYGLIHRRQLMDPRDPTKASYSGLVRCQAKVERIREPRFLGPATVKFHQFLDPQIVQYMGIVTSPNDEAWAISPCAYTCDVVVEAGTVPWEECGSTSSRSAPSTTAGSSACCWCAWPRLWLSLWSCWLPRPPKRACGCRCH